jgi:hypothetical protein
MRMAQNRTAACAQTVGQGRRAQRSASPAYPASHGQKAAPKPTAPQAIARPHQRGVVRSERGGHPRDALYRPALRDWCPAGHKRADPLVARGRDAVDALRGKVGRIDPGVPFRTGITIAFCAPSRWTWRRSGPLPAASNTASAPAYVVMRAGLATWPRSGRQLSGDRPRWPKLCFPRSRSRSAQVRTVVQKAGNALPRCPSGLSGPDWSRAPRLPL